MFKIQTILKSILLAGCFLIFLSPVLAQNWEADFVRKINPDHPTSSFWKATTGIAKPLSVGLPVAMLATSLITKDKVLQDQSIEMVGGLAITIVATEGLKIIADRQRPYQKYSGIYPDQYEDGKSFPSGHTSVAFSTATSLSINHKKWYVIVPAYTWATAVGISRMYFGQHYPTDIIGAAVVGAGSAWLAHKANRWIVSKKKSNQK
jgi:undecaprenyl-diphosphatase